MYEDSSFNSDNGQIVLTDTKTNLVLLDNQNNKINSDRIYLNVHKDNSTQSDKVPSSYHTQTDEKDGYETCIDESLSEDVCAKINIESNLKTDDIVQIPVKRSDLDYAVSEPCLTFSKDNHLFLDSKQDVELKSYDHHNDDSLGADEFFLIQYPPDQVMKCRSEPAVLNAFSEQCLVQKSYIRRLEEYYNDYEHCMENYRVCDKITEEPNDDDIFRDIIIPIRSSSAPDILDSSFVTLTYDPGPSTIRRKSAFAFGCEEQDR